MITIIEGTDCVGKTEYAQKLAAARGCEYRHAGAPTHLTWWEEYTEPLHKGQDIVLDRWHVGEMVWPRIFGRTSLFSIGSSPRRDWARFETCNRAISLLGAELIIVVRDTAGIVVSLSKRGELAQCPDVLEGQRRFMDLALRIRNIETTVIHSDSLRGRWQQWSSIA